MNLYVVTNLVTGKRYVGITVKPIRARWQSHCADAKRGSAFRLHVAIRSYGAAAFSVEHVLCALTWRSLCELEVSFIAELETHISRGGYNMTLGGEGAFGLPKSPETRAKIAAKHKGKKLSAEHRALLSAARKGRPVPADTLARRIASQTGSRRSAETRARLSAAAKARYATVEAARLIHSPEARTKAAQKHRGQKRSLTTRAKMRAAQIGKRHSAGSRLKMSLAKRQMTAETKAKIAAANRARPPEVNAKIAATLKGRRPSAEARARQSAAQMGHKLTAETRAKISAAHKGKIMSAEARAKMSAAKTAMYASAVKKTLALVRQIAAEPLQ